MDLKDRIVGLERIPASELLDHAGNPRRHPAAQKEYMKGILQEVGIVDALIAYKSERNGGKVCLIDGHLRKNEFDVEWPVIMTDLNDEEADKILATFDSITSYADVDQESFNELVENLNFDDAALRQMIADAAGSLDSTREASEKESGDDEDSVEEMELQPYEHYDYVLVLFRNTWDWNAASTKLGLKRVDSSQADNRKIGLGRVVDGSVLLELLNGGAKSEGTSEGPAETTDIDKVVEGIVEQQPE